ncbi:MAG: pyruvate formate lyase family protein [Eubacteriales bacterium]|nr:pyruvate formate lyase family protein [Eubacteriales bacterium]
MTERIARLRDYFTSGRQKENLTEHRFHPEIYRNLPSLSMRSAIRLREMLRAQRCVFAEDSELIPMRTTKAAPDIFTEEEWERIKSTHTIHESGWMSNVCPDYGKILSTGLDALLKTAEVSVQSGTADDRETAAAQIVAFRAILAFAERYRKAAERAGRNELAETLRRVPAQSARTYREALQFFRLLHFALWCEGNYHVIAGRADQFLYPYYRHDLESGRLTEETALEMTCDFFLSFNCDSYLYPGMQRGDNGQSLMLGGCDENGNDCFNDLSALMLRAALELKVIDPKINLRVDSRTPLERYELASRLTAVGIGFPQYANDDVVIPGLEALGYSHADACNYVVAACWEFIIPGKGADVPNIDAFPFLGVVDRVIRAQLKSAVSYEELFSAVRKEIRRETRAITTRHNALYFRPAPLLTALMQGIPGGKDISFGATYNNYGIHGTGLAPAADALSAVRTLVYERKEIAPADFLAMLDADYVGYERERNLILRETPRMGNDCEADGIGSELLSCFAESLQGIRNDRGGIWRAGCASAMYYVSHAATQGATADGRHAGDYLPANYSPSLLTTLNGPLSVIRSFTKADMRRTVNGGPLTLEFSPSVFATEDGIKKLALLVRCYIQLGGHQLQLNVIDRASLLDAQQHPEKYRNLIVRVWGWSGYFTELDKVYQDQIIQRAVLTAD